MTKANEARLFATAAHAAVKQVRKYTGEPYIRHPESVAAIVASVPHTEAMVCAAYLHDVVEDTGITSEDIYREFGEEVGRLVSWLTDSSKPSDGNREVRKAIDRERLSTAPWDAQTVKLADLIDNTVSIVARDPDFARVYMQEKSLLLEILTRGDATLWKRANDQVDEYLFPRSAA